MLNSFYGKQSTVESNIIVFDLEWANQSIVQIGAVRISLSPFRISDTFCGFSAPCDDSALEKCVGFLGMDRATLTTAESVHSIIQRFLDWCGDNVSYATWGVCDFPVLMNNMKRYHISATLLPDYYYDVQAAFQAQIGALHRLALSLAVDYCGIPDCYSYHDALNDSLYTALVLAATGSGLIVQNSNFEVSNLNREQMYTWQEQCKSIDELMHLRELHRQLCPMCSAPFGISEWFGVRNKKLRLIAKSHCPKHGIIYTQVQLQHCLGEYTIAKLGVQISNDHLKRIYDHHSQRRFESRNINGKKSDRHGKALHYQT